VRIHSIKIYKWRHFEGIELVLPPTAPIVCVVGGNGTGKSQILELIAACAQRIGLSPGTESSRGDPFGDEAHFEIRFVIAANTVPALEAAAPRFREFEEVRANWDRSLTVTKHANGNVVIAAGGMPSAVEQRFASAVVDTIRESASVHYLSLGIH
jgi:predicted ATP-dependent endonuclease of OLD family